MDLAVTQNIRSTTALVWDGLTAKISRAAGPIQTRPQLQHGKWVLVPDTQLSTATGGVGIGERSPDLVRGGLVIHNFVLNISLQGHSC